MNSDAKRREDPWSSSSSDEEDVEDDDDRVAFYSICSYSHCRPSAAPSFATLSAALDHDVRQHGFDLLRHAPSARDEDGFFEGAIVLVNKCRRFMRDVEEGDDVPDGRELGRRLSEFLESPAKPAEDEAYYRPVLEDDAVLMCIDELLELKREREGGRTGSAPHNATEEAMESDCKAPETMESLRAEISFLEENLARAQGLIASLAREDDADHDGSEGGDRSKSALRTKKPDNDSYYFSSYSNTSIHETMLRDTVRTAAYEEAILSNAEALFRGKTVLDIGCGTGVLSLFCAKAGAKKVIAVDNSDIITMAKKIVARNGFADVVTCVRGKMETLLEEGGLPLARGETVDVVVSEWMGYALFFETMLPSVLAARDALVAPGTGTMFPNVSAIFLEGADASGQWNYWNDVHSIDMTPMKARLASEVTREASVELVPEENIVTERVKLIEHDLNACRDAELDFAVPFELRLRDSAATTTGATVELHQLVVSFDIRFAVPGTREVSFSTGCQGPATHWKQTVLWCDPVHGDCPRLNGAAGESLRGTFHMRRGTPNHRDIDMAVVWETGKGDDDGGWTKTGEGVLKRSLIA